MSVFRLRNRKDYAYPCPQCEVAKGRPCVGREVQNGLVHFGRRLIRIMHEKAAREGKTFEQVESEMEDVLTKGILDQEGSR